MYVLCFVRTAAACSGLLGDFCGLAASALAGDPLDEVRKSFTIGGKPIPQEIFADFGDAMMSDSRAIMVTIDANAAIDSNRYADPIKTNHHWVDQTKPGSARSTAPKRSPTSSAEPRPMAYWSWWPPGPAAAAGHSASRGEDRGWEGNDFSQFPQILGCGG